MKIIVQEDGCQEITIIQQKNNPQRPWENKTHDECRYFHRHYVQIENTNTYVKADDGHCYAPKSYSYKKIHSYCGKACTWFKPIKID